jgi:DNA mismatch endonuclease (patch repair protein)
MADRITKEKRSKTMRMVKSNRNKSTELKLIKYFKENGIKGWRRNYKLFGRPDFVFPSKHIALFADGCFWHGHFCRTHIPYTNKDYWERKINNNIERDKMVADKLTQKGWMVFRVWECEIKNSRLPCEFLDMVTNRK